MDNDEWFLQIGDVVVFLFTLTETRRGDRQGAWIRANGFEPTIEQMR